MTTVEVELGWLLGVVDTIDRLRDQLLEKVADAYIAEREDVKKKEEVVSHASQNP